MTTAVWILLVAIALLVAAAWRFSLVANCYPTVFLTVIAVLSGGLYFGGHFA
jgi:hypothetical protein